MYALRNIKRTISNLSGWRINRRIIIFESDDWGSIRMPSRRIYNKLLNAGLNLNGGDGLRYSLFDTLASSSDFELLFELLNTFRDFNNIPAAFTANSVVANPDFEKIKENDFQHYYYELFTETLKKYNRSETTFKLWKEGISNRVFVPQFHGREHLNVPIWMRALRANDVETHMAFNEGMWSFIPKQLLLNGLEYEAAYQLDQPNDLETYKEIIIDGLNIFAGLFDYKAKYFVPPNGRINNSLNLTCYNEGIRYRSASEIQHEAIGFGKTKKRRHWLGQKDVNGIRYIVRNCNFEPSKSGKDWIDSCLNDIKIAFFMNKPAIISTHRVNYVGTHDVLNRDNGLKKLKELLTAIKKYWIDVQFLTTDQLGSLIDNEINT